MWIEWLNSVCRKLPHMNILAVIKDCIENPCFAKDYDLEEYTIDKTSDTQTVTNESIFSGLSSFKKGNISSKTSSIDQRMVRMYMRIWNGLGKSIVKTLTDGNCFISLSLGYFFSIKGSLSQFAYSPTLEIIERYGLTLIEDPYNMHPTNRFVIL